MSHRRAFSLVELLVVIGIVAVLAAILFPVLAVVKARAKVTSCQSHLQQVAFGMQQYRADYDGQAWLEYWDSAAKRYYTTAGGGGPWNEWYPASPYIKDVRIVFCPSPSRNPVFAYNLTILRTIATPQKQTPKSTTVFRVVDPDPGRVVAFCDNHATEELEQPTPIGTHLTELWKGIYPAVREDGSTFVAKSSEIQLWYLWQDGTWHPSEQSIASQVWRFPKEPWPPTVPNM